ncbi:SCO4225 family membrane protein [Streptomyces sp. NPDC014779]|uniref:SCO4225 family membrane protein n=1 Tax=Streptomyces sp. NPDC014779 TaxID=3364911 RepID=UPI0036F8F49C
MPTASHPHRAPLLRRLLTLVAGHGLSRGYLAVCAVSFAAMLLAPDSTFAGSPLLLTAPLSFLCLFLPLDPGAEIDGAADITAVAVFTAWLALCALVNAAVLGALATRSSIPTPNPTSAPTPATVPIAPLPHPAPVAGTRPRGLRTLLAPAVDNWLSRGYLAVVAVALGFSLCAEFLTADPGFAGIWPLMATAPFSLVATAVATPVAYYSSIAWLSPLVFSLGVVLSGLVNAVLLGLLVRGLRTRERRAAA